MSTYISGMLITPKYPDRIYLEWSMFNPSINTNYFFNIYYSDNPRSNWIKLNTLPIPNVTQYEFDFPLLFKAELLFIKVEAVVDGHSSSISSTFISNVPMDTLLILKEIQRKFDLVREVYTGVPCTIKKKKIIGTKCTICTDQTTGFKKKNTCEACWGTQIVGGYSDGIDSICEIVEVPMQQSPSEIGTTEMIIATMQITSPPIYKGDIVVENQRNKRWYVQKILERNNYKTYLIDQKVELRQLSPKDIEYGMEI